MSRRLDRIHNKDFRKAARLIIANTIEAGGEPSDVMVILESTVSAVMSFLYRDPEIARQMFEDALVPGVVGRLTERGVSMKIKAGNDNGETIQ